jgi:predicted nucleotidyltransferase
MVDESQLKKFVEQLHSAHGDNLSCVLLYGSAATGQEGIINSDYNLLVALKRISPDDLKRAQPSMSRWREMGNPLPVFFTERELTAAVDVFPIEFNQMRRSRKVLYGNDPFTNPSHIEPELKTSDRV